MHTVFQIDWHKFLIGEDSWSFLLEVMLRSLIMFIVVLICLRKMGTRAVLQGVFEVALIVSLGSAAGDAMFYSNVGMLPAILVFVMVLVIYKIITFFVSKSDRLERMLEGEVFCLILDGAFVFTALKKEQMATNEIYSDLRNLNVSQLGQIKQGYIEPSGKLSLYFYPDNETKYGLCVLPEQLKLKFAAIQKTGYYACANCGHTENLEPVDQFICRRCDHDKCCEADCSVRMK
jgi:uncharacterized membrane protein YcaP (DUF421 family)